jgi:hypothetical protein
MLRVKSGVSLRGLQPQTVLMAVVIDQAHQQAGNDPDVETVITAGSEQVNGRVAYTRHNSGCALDFRAMDEAERVVSWSMARLGADFDIIIHGDGDNRHIHAEYDPKR